MEHVMQFWLRTQLKTILREVGGATEAFDAFIADGGKGDVSMRKLQTAAEASGIAGQFSVQRCIPFKTYHLSTTAGVPHYFVPPALTPDGRARGLFGREHLALIRGWLHVRCCCFRVAF